MYKISVILPVYGVHDFLPAALSSLQQQTIGFDQLQVLFADDCSTDGSWDLVQQYAQQYDNVQCVRLETNSGGCGEPRNEALKLATAPYVVYMDPDDLLPPAAYEILYNEIQHTDAEIVTGWYDIKSQDGRVLAEKCSEVFCLSGTRDFNMPQDLEISFATLPMVWCKIYRRDFLFENGLRFAYGIPGEDQAYTVQCYLRAKKVRYIDECVYHYVRRTQEGQSLSSDLSARYFNGIRQCIHIVQNSFNEAGQQQAGTHFVDGLVESQMQLLCLTTRLSPSEWQAQLNAFLPWLKEANGPISMLLYRSSEPAYETAKILRKLIVQEKDVQEYANALRCENERILKEIACCKEWVEHLLASQKELQDALAASTAQAAALETQLQEHLQRKTLLGRLKQKIRGWLR